MVRVTDAPPPSVAARFAQIMALLRTAIATACGPPAIAARLADLPRQVLAPHLARRLHDRLGKMMQTFAALVAHLAEFGADAPPRAPRRKRAPRPDAAAATAGDNPETNAQGIPWAVAAAAAALAATPGFRPEPSPPRAPRPPRLPGNAGWLAGMSCSVGCSASQLRHLLTDPEMLALLRASPAVLQLLRPLFRMLGVDLPAEFQPPQSAEPKRPRRLRRRLWRPPSRRSDMLLLLRMGTPLIRT